MQSLNAENGGLNKIIYYFSGKQFCLQLSKCSFRLEDKVKTDQNNAKGKKYITLLRPEENQPSSHKPLKNWSVLPGCKHFKQVKTS